MGMCCYYYMHVNSWADVTQDIFIFIVREFGNENKSIMYKFHGQARTQQEAQCYITTVMDKST